MAVLADSGLRDNGRLRVTVVQVARRNRKELGILRMETTPSGNDRFFWIIAPYVAQISCAPAKFHGFGSKLVRTCMWDRGRIKNTKTAVSRSSNSIGAKQNSPEDTTEKVCSAPSRGMGTWRNCENKMLLFFNSNPKYFEYSCSS